MTWGQAQESKFRAQPSGRLALVWQYITREMAADAEPQLDRQAAELYRLLNPMR